jgi:hypothetical protein
MVFVQKTNTTNWVCRAIGNGYRTSLIHSLYIKDLQLWSKWLNYNKLKLNVEKTKFMVTKNKRIVKNMRSHWISTTNLSSEWLIWNTLEWKLDDHGDKKIKKIRRKYGFICRANEKLTTESKILSIFWVKCNSLQGWFIAKPFQTSFDYFSKIQQQWHNPNYRKVTIVTICDHLWHY